MAIEEVGALRDFDRKTAAVEGHSNQSAWSAAAAIAQRIRHANEITKTRGAPGFLDVIVVGSRVKGYATDTPSTVDAKISDYDFAVLYDSRVPGSNYQQLVKIVARELREMTDQNSIKDPEDHLKYITKKEYNAHFFVDIACPDVSGDEYFDYIVRNSIVLGYWYLWQMQEPPGELRSDAIDLKSVFEEHRARCATMAPDQKEKIFRQVFAWLTSDEVARFSKLRDRHSESGVGIGVIVARQDAYNEDVKQKVTEFIGHAPNNGGI